MSPDMGDYANIYKIKENPFGKYVKPKKTSDKSVNFMDGRNIKDFGAHYKNLDALIEGQISNADADDNSTISLEEYVNNEYYQDLTKIFNEEYSKKDSDSLSGFEEYNTTEELFNMQDYDSGGVLDKKEHTVTSWLANMLGTKDKNEYTKDEKYTVSEYAEAVILFGMAKGEMGTQKNQLEAKAITDDLFSYFEEE